MVSELRKLRRLSRQEVLLLPRILWLTGKVVVLQRILSVTGLVRHFDASSAARTAPPVPPERLAHLTRAVLYRIYRNDFCMKQSLVLFHFLTKWGYPAHVRFGVMKRDGELVGHAWVLLDGAPLGETHDPDAQYKVTFAYP